MLPNWSNAVSVKLKGTPACVVAGAVNTKWVAGAGDTMTMALPLIPGCGVSTAPRGWLPDVRNVAVKFPTPLVNVLVPGNVDWTSFTDVKWMASVKPVAT